MTRSGSRSTSGAGSLFDCDDLRQLLSCSLRHHRRIMVVSGVDPAGRRNMRIEGETRHVERAVRITGRKTQLGVASLRPARTPASACSADSVDQRKDQTAPAGAAFGHASNGLSAKCFQCAADLVRQVDRDPHQLRTGAGQAAHGVCGPTFDPSFSIPAGPNQLRQRLGIMSIGLVPLPRAPPSDAASGPPARVASQFDRSVCRVAISACGTVDPLCGSTRLDRPQPPLPALRRAPDRLGRGLPLRRFQRHPATPNCALLIRFELGS